MEKTALELVEVAVKTARKQALEARCLNALSKLSSLRLSNKFLVSTDAANLIDSLKCNPHLKPVIREYADRVITRWKRQFHSRTQEEKPSQPPCDSKAKSPPPTNTLKNPCSTLNRQEKVGSNLKPKIPRPQNNTKSPNGSDQLRSNIQRQIFEGLNLVLKESSEGSFNCCDPVGVAMCVESALFQVWGGNLQKYRSFLFNLKDSKNPDFRRKILTGQLKPEEIATLRAEDMASDARRIQNHFIRESALQKCIVGREPIC